MDLSDPSNPQIPKFAVQMMGVPFFIGTFVIEWSKHEQLLAQLLATLEQRDYKTVRQELLDGFMSDYEKRLRTAAQERPDSDVAAQIVLRDVIQEHARLREARHTIIHGYWSGLSKEEELLVQRKRRKEEQTVKAMPVANLIELVRDLQSLNRPILNALRTLQGMPLSD